MDTSALLTRALLFMEDGEWTKADECCERVLDVEPENPRAHITKLMVQLKVSREEELGDAQASYAGWSSYCHACRYADEETRQRLEQYLQSTQERIRQREETQRQEKDKRQKESFYQEACRYQKALPREQSLRDALRLFNLIPDYADSKERAQECQRQLLQQEERDKKLRIEREKKQRQRKIKRWVTAVVVAGLIAIVVLCVSVGNAHKAQDIQDRLTGMEFTGTYNVIDSYSSNGSWGVVRELTRYEVTYQFAEYGTVIVDTVKRNDGGAHISVNGDRQWDSETWDTEVVNGGEVHISLFGTITVRIDGRDCVLNLDSNGDPVSFLIDETTYTKK